SLQILGWTLLFANVLAAPAAQDRAPAQPFSMRWISRAAATNGMAVEVSGLSATALGQLRGAQWEPTQWQRLLSVYAEPGDSIAGVGLPPMMGAYRVQSGALRFEPRFPLEPGVKYRAVFRPDQLPNESGWGGGPITS